MITYYSVCASNERIPVELLYVKTDQGMPEGRGRAEGFPLTHSQTSD